MKPKAFHAKANSETALNMLGIEGALWAYLAAGMLQTALAAWALRDRLLRP